MSRQFTIGFLCVAMWVPALAQAERTQEEEEAALEADMEAAHRRVLELRNSNPPAPSAQEEEDSGRRWPPHRRFHRSKPIVVSVSPCARCGEEPRARSTFFAEPLVIGWTMLNQKSAAYGGLKIGGLIRERLQMSASFNGTVTYRPDAEGGFAALALGGVETSVLLLHSRFIRIGLGAFVGGGLFGYTRSGGLEYGSVFAVTPMASVEVRPARWLAFGAEGGYRFAFSAPSAALNFKSLSAPQVSGFIRFGL